MIGLPTSRNHWGPFFVLMGKVVIFSWPMGLFLLALNALPVVIENVLTSRELWLGVIPSLVVAAKLWVFFVIVNAVVPSVMFWSGVKASRQRTTDR